MISVNQSRVRPQDRVQTPSDKTPTAQTKTYTAPIGGLVTNANMAAQAQQTAVVLENFWPTATGIAPRGGAKHRVTIPAAVESLFEYRAGPTGLYFVADAGNIYSFAGATPDGTTLSPAVTGQTSGVYSHNEMQTDGGSFLSIVNGHDHLQIYDGNIWQEVTGASAPFAITGVATNDLSHVWSYNNRQYFIEKGTTNAWYLGVNSVAGVAEKLPLAGVFRKGGSLLFGAAWSSDSGEDMNDRCVFVTDQGEFAVYRGDPSSAGTWSFDGVYDLGVPLGPDAVMSVGGDLIVGTKDGLVPLSAAVQKDVAELKLSTLSRAIEPDWRNEVLLSGSGHGWQVVKWANRNMAIIAPPLAATDSAECYVVNLETKAWSKFTGWRVNACGLLGSHLHYGSQDGRVFMCDVGGTDEGALIPCRACFAFDQLTGAAFKAAHLVRGVFRHITPYEAQFSVAADYQPNFLVAPNSVLDTGGTASAWDVAAWDVAAWDEGDWASGTADWGVSSVWDGVSGQGHALAIQMQITSGAPYKLACELVSVDLVYSSGAVVT